MELRYPDEEAPLIAAGLPPYDKVEKLFVLTIKVPVRGFTAKGANAIKAKLLEKLPELAAIREIEGFRITTIWTDDTPKVYYRLGTLVGIQSTAIVRRKQFTLLKGDVEEYLAGLSIDYPKMQHPVVEVD